MQAAPLPYVEWRTTHRDRPACSCVPRDRTHALRDQWGGGCPGVTLSHRSNLFFGLRLPTCHGGKCCRRTCAAEVVSGVVLVSGRRHRCERAGQACAGSFPLPEKWARRGDSESLGERLRWNSGLKALCKTWRRFKRPDLKIPIMCSFK